MILFILLFLNSVFADVTSEHNLGVITQAKGKVTFFPYQGLRKVETLSTKSIIHEGGSYLAHENSNFTVKLFDGSWLKVSPTSKFSIEMDSINKEIQLHLYSGSIKILFASSVTQSKMQKFIVISGDGRFETSEAKFSVFRNMLESTGYVYVEKGLVRASKSQLETTSAELVHRQEMTAVKDRDSTIESPRKISENQMKFLNSSFYLGQSRPSDSQL
jgi:ferric-dicitrate binding protein FerR (iron transport regulator)